MASKQFKAIITVDIDKLRKCRSDDTDGEVGSDHKDFDVSGAVYSEFGWLEDSGISLDELKEMGGKRGRS